MYEDTCIKWRKVVISEDFAMPLVTKIVISENCSIAATVVEVVNTYVADGVEWCWYIDMIISL